jgi:hypothetical protein
MYSKKDKQENLIILTERDFSLVAPGLNSCEKRFNLKIAELMF